MLRVTKYYQLLLDIGQSQPRHYRGIAKLVRHQVLILTSVGSSPATPAIFYCNSSHQSFLPLFSEFEQFDTA